MGRKGFSEAPVNLIETDKWQKIRFFAKVYGWTPKQLKELSAKEGNCFLLMEERDRQKKQEDNDLAKSRQEGKDMLKERFG